MRKNDTFSLPDTPEVNESDFVRSQPWFEARENCNACARAYNLDLDRRNKAIGRGEITWTQYYEKKDISCSRHKETLEQFLKRDLEERELWFCSTASLGLKT